MKKENWIRVSEYAREKGITTKTVYERIKRKELTSKKEYGLTLVKA